MAEYHRNQVREHPGFRVCSVADAGKLTDWLAGDVAHAERNRNQKDDSQVDDLTAFGCDKIFIDKASGKLAARPELDKPLACLRQGDVFVITRLSRAMRSLKHLLALADELRERGVGLVVLKQHIDTTAPTGRLVFHIPGAIDEFQRELIVEGTREGLDATRARGRTGGQSQS
jgi:DNA invertase Pin-like site-specific DNA recombinase